MEKIKIKYSFFEFTVFKLTETKVITVRNFKENVSKSYERRAA